MRTFERLTATEIAVEKEQRWVDRRSSRLNQFLAFLLVLVAAVYIGTSGAPRLFDQIDGQYAGAAREMIVR
jgi:hypothetical protein